MSQDQNRTTVLGSSTKITMIPPREPQPKKLYFKLSDGADIESVVMTLEDAMSTIETDCQDQTDQLELEDRQYTLVPIFLTESEYMDLHEANM